MAANGGVLTPASFAGLQAKPASSVTERGSCVFLYSKGGGGKTTLAGSAADSPEDSPLVVFDAEGGASVLSDRSNIDVVDITEWSQLAKIEAAIKKGEPLPWRTIVHDNLSEYQQLAIDSIAGKGNQPTQPQWGAIQRRMQDFIRFYRDDVARKLGLNVIFIAWDSVERDETNKLVFRLNFIPSLQKTIPGIVDIIGYIEPHDRDPQHKRSITFETTTKTDAKFRRNRSAAAQAIPLRLEYGLDNLPLPDILNTLRRGVPFPVSKYPTTQK